MKACASCVQELLPPCIGGREIFSSPAITSRFNTISNVRRKERSGSLSTQYFDYVVMTAKIHVITSICACAPFPSCRPHYHFKQKVLNPPRGNTCSCFSSDAEILGELGDKDQSVPKSLNNSDLNSEAEEVECSGPGEVSSDSDSEQTHNEDGIVIHITKIGKRSRRIESNVQINASLSTIWDVLTDYERLADFIPGLALSRLLEKRDNYVRLFQIGQQNLVLGLKFNAKAVLDCYEMELEHLSFGQRRDIKFRMVEGDFEIFDGKWSIEQYYADCEEGEELGSLEGQEFNTVLSYFVEVKPKLWLPVRLVEGRLCSEIKTNLSCVRKEAQIRSQSSPL